MRNDENFLLMQLSKCRIIDKRTRKLLNVVNVLEELLEAGCPVMDTQLLAQIVPGRLVALFFQYPCNSILQGSLCKCFLEILGRPGTPELCSAALTGSSGLTSSCAKVGSECAALSMGRRPGQAFLKQVLREKVDASIDVNLVAALSLI